MANKQNHVALSILQFTTARLATHGNKMRKVIRGIEIKQVKVHVDLQRSIEEYKYFTDEQLQTTQLLQEWLGTIFLCFHSI